MKNIVITFKRGGGKGEICRFQVNYVEIAVSLIILTLVLTYSDELRDSLPQTIVGVGVLVLIYYVFRAAAALLIVVWNIALMTGMVIFHPFIWLIGRRGFLVSRRTFSETTLFTLSTEGAFRLRGPKRKRTK